MTLDIHVLPCSPDLLARPDLAALRAANREQLLPRGHMSEPRRRASRDPSVPGSEVGSTASGARFQALLSLANDAIFLSEPGGRLIEVNQAACDRLGFSRAELLTMTAADINAPETLLVEPARASLAMRQSAAVLGRAP